MADLPVKVSLQIVGNNIVSNELYTNQYTIIAKSEEEFFEIINTDGELPVGISKKGTISHIIADSTNAKIKITTSAPDSFEIPINGKLFWEVPSAFSNTITNIAVLTDSTTKVNCTISVWGIDVAE